MAVFRPNKKNVCEFNFDDKCFFELPLHEDVNAKLVDISNRQLEEIKKIDINDPDGTKKIYNLSLDALDEIFGEGAGAEIMSIFENPSLFDVAEVVTYITTTFKDEFEKFVNEHKAKGTIPSSNAARPTHPALRGRK